MNRSLLYHRKNEPGRPNGVTIFAGLPGSNCQRPLAAEPGRPNGVTISTGLPGSNRQRRLAAESGRPNGVAISAGLPGSTGLSGPPDTKSAARSGRAFCNKKRGEEKMKKRENNLYYIKRPFRY